MIQVFWLGFFLFFVLYFKSQNHAEPGRLPPLPSQLARPSTGRIAKSVQKSIIVCKYRTLLLADTLGTPLGPRTSREKSCILDSICLKCFLSPPHHSITTRRAAIYHEQAELN